MLGRIQEFTTKVNKKRIYTAVGAMVVALATGHLMQRNVSTPTISVDMAQQPTPVVPVVANMTAPVMEQTVVAQTTPEMFVTPDAPQEDLVVANDEPLTATVAAPELAVELVADANTPAETAMEIDFAFAEPEQASEPEVIATVEPDATADLVLDFTAEPEVTRAQTDNSIGIVQETPVLDIAPPAATLSPATDTTACEPILTATALTGALVAINFDAPCNAGNDVEFLHAGLRFTEELAEDGTVSILLPALTATAEIEVTLNEVTYDASVTVPDMGDVDRVALMWKGGTGLQLHALENGAFYGEPGHIWAENPGLPERATKGEGGYVTVLGSSIGGYAADVYSYPVSMTVEPQISIEAQVLDSTCGTTISGEYLRSSSTNAPTTVEVGMSVPPCDAVGEYLVLKNLPTDLTIARK